MKFLFIFIAVLFSINTFADSAPVVPVQGSSVKPVNNNDIKMKNEVVDIYLYRKFYKVNVKYVFVNTGKKQSVIMGFPNIDNWMQGEGIKDYTVFEDGKKVKTKRKNILSEEELEKIKSRGYGEVKYFETSKHFFKKGQKKVIINKYRQNYMYDYDDTYRKAVYILKTGALWKDKIENIKVNIHFMDLSIDELYNRTGYFYEDKKLSAKMNYKFEILPEDYKTVKNVIKYEFKDLEPDFNIEITLPPVMFRNVEADSTLTSKKINKYAPENMIDNNPKTAWVEGKKGFGKGIKLYFAIAPTTAGGKIDGDYLIEKIGIINGYAKSKKLFYANNRVKKIRFDYWSMKEDKELTKYFTLKDKFEMQYIRFENPVSLSNFRITILSVYKGKRYNDTCISEIKVFPLEEDYYNEQKDLEDEMADEVCGEAECEKNLDGEE